MAFLLAIEGADGAGKATTAAEVATQLRQLGRTAAVLSFPRYAETTGGWALGEYLAGRLPRDVPTRSAAVMYALDRFESRDHLLQMAAAHEVLVFDRYIASNQAYQGAKVPEGEAAALMDWIWRLETEQFALPPADLTVYLDTPLEVARRLILKKQQRSYTDQALDAYEADTALQRHVRVNYAALAAGDGWATVHTTAGGETRPPHAIGAEVVALCLAALDQR